jgi:mono/diheme cytochrome c family protein
MGCLIITVSASLFLPRAVAQESGVPESKPDAVVGLEIFADRCADCHGFTGEGDGELAVNLEIPPVSFADPAYRKTALPGVMFETVFNGRFEAQMPPFGPGTENSNPIDEPSIWNLVATVYSLSTPTDSIAQGEVVYEANCAACHGESGGGDGPDAAGFEDANLDLSNLSYWFSRNNETVFADLNVGSDAEHDFELDEDDLWAVVDYARTFSYIYADPLAPVPAIESAAISGLVRNGTTNEILTSATARLRAFTAAFEETLNITTTVGSDGYYRFELGSVPPDLIYLTNIVYGGFSFSSDAAQLSHAQIELDLPVTVYDQTTDAAAISIEQVHVILDFFEGGITVSELYVFSNREAAVFVGETGKVEEGTVQVSLPEGAENIMFERTMGSFETTIPATEFIQTENGWADTLPLSPGQGGLNLLVRYELPYEDGVSLSHRLAYSVANATVIVPDVGVELNGEGWNLQGSQQMGDGISFLTYDRAGIVADTDLELNLDGRPQFSSGGNATIQVGRDQAGELLIGAGVLLIAVAAGLYTVRKWQTAHVREDHHEDYEDRSEISTLIRAISELDDDFENGELDEEDYTDQRDRMKKKLRSMWE